MDFKTWWENEAKNLCADTVWRKGDLLSLAKDAWNAALSAPAPAGDVDKYKFALDVFREYDSEVRLLPFEVWLCQRKRLSAPGKEGA